MKLYIALLLLALSAVPAFAQGKGRSMDQPKTAPKEDAAKKKADEEAYQRALKIIPDSKVKVDPWQNAR